MRRAGPRTADIAPEHRSGPAILLIDDNPSDARLVRIALEDGSVGRVDVVEDGERALAFLRRVARRPGVPRPDLVLLDLDLPGLDGRHVLSGIKSDAELMTTPVVVFTTSTAAADVRACYELHANAYVVKPMDFDAFERTVRTIADFWLGTALRASFGE